MAMVLVALCRVVFWLKLHGLIGIGLFQISVIFSGTFMLKSLKTFALTHAVCLIVVLVSFYCFLLDILLSQKQ